MAIAYHLLAHKNPGQVDRLMRVLYHPEDLFIFHFDRRAPRELHALGRDWARGRINVLVQHPRAVLWGGPQIPNLQIEAMALALRQSPQWTHFINLSGQDFPLRPRTAIVAHLAATPHTSYVDYFDPFETKQWANLDQRLRRWHLHWLWLHRLLEIRGIGRRVRALLGWQNEFPHLTGYRRPIPVFFRYYGGSNHAVIARAGCEHLCHDPQARRICRWLAHSAIPDESLFQSVLLNSPLASTVMRRHWRHFEFPSDTPHPMTFRAADFDRLVATDAWFARKFDDQVDAAILDRLEKHVLTGN